MASKIVQSEKKAIGPDLGIATRSEGGISEAEIFKQFYCRYVLEGIA